MTFRCCRIVASFVMNTWKLSRLVAGVIVLLLCFAAAIGAVALLRLQTVAGCTRDLVEDQVPSVLTVGQLRALTKDGLIGALAYVSTEDAATRARIEERSEAITGEMAAHYDFYEKNCVSDEEDRAVLMAMKKAGMPFESLRKR